MARLGRTAHWTELKTLVTHQLVHSIPALSRWTTGLTDQRGREDNPQPPILFQMATGYWVSQCIYVAAKLGLADLLKSGAKNSDELAALTSVDRRCLFRLMRALATVGIFRELRDGRFVLLDLGRSLQSDAPESLRALVITLGEIHYQAWGELLYSVQTGSAGFNRVFGTGMFDYLCTNAHAAEAFNDGMADVSAKLAYAVTLAYDFSGISSVVDVGGGQGTFLRKLLKLNPELTGTVFDLDPAIERAKKLVTHETDVSRYRAMTGDFFDSIPEGADAYLLCDVLHDWDDDRSVTILENCRRACGKRGKLLLIEVVLPEGSSNCFSKFLDLNMLVMNGGRERTKSELNDLLATTGYRLTRILRTLAPQSVVEAVPY